jgi:hypothetical protein
MTGWELWHSDVTCDTCGAEYRYIVQHPPIPMIVEGFYDEDGRPVPGDECRRCGEALPVPDRIECVGHEGPPLGGARKGVPS